MAGPLFQTTSSGDAPVLAQQGVDPNRALLAQLLASQQNLPPARTAQAATMQGLAGILSGATNGFLAGADRREREAGAKEIAALYGAPAPAESPGLIQRAANFIGLGDDKPAAAAPSPTRMQLASAMNPDTSAPDAPATVGRYDPGATQPTAPVRALMTGATNAADGQAGAPYASPSSTASAPNLTTREGLARALASVKSPQAQAVILNRIAAFDDAQQKFQFERDKADYDKGLRALPDGSVVERTNYGPSLGAIKAAALRAETAPKLELRQGEKEQDLAMDPRRAAAIITAETAPKVAQETALNPVRASGAAATQLATDTAALKNAEALARSRSQGTATGTANAELAAAPAAPGVTPGKTVAEALAEARGRGTQTAQGTGPNQQRESQLRGDFDALPAVKAYRQTVKEYGGIVDASQRDNKTANLNMVYGLAKILDPESVVREGEVTTVKNTASWPEYLKGAVSTLQGGGNLTPETRDQIIREARGRLDATQGIYSQFSQAYKDIAGRNGLNHENVVVDLAAPTVPNPQRRLTDKPETMPAARGIAAPAPQRGAQAAPAYTPEQVQAEIARRAAARQAQ